MTTCKRCERNIEEHEAGREYTKKPMDNHTCEDRAMIVFQLQAAIVACEESEK